MTASGVAQNLDSSVGCHALLQGEVLGRGLVAQCMWHGVPLGGQSFVHRKEACALIIPPELNNYKRIKKP